MGGKWMAYTGLALSALSVLFLLMDGGMKAMGASVSIEATQKLGFEPQTTRLLGVILIICTVLYAVPQTSVLGALLITAYLGGAVAIQLQQNAPLFSHTLFGVYVGLIVWGGLWFRLASLRDIIPVFQ